MVVVKAFAVGIVTGVLTPVVVMVASYMSALSGFSRAYYYLAPYPATIGSAVSIHAPSWPTSSAYTFELLTQVAVGFGVGFLFVLWRALVMRQVQ